MTTFMVKHSNYWHSLYNVLSLIDIKLDRISIHEEVLKIYVVHDQVRLVFRLTGCDYDLCAL